MSTSVAPQATSPSRRVAAQAALELRINLRNGEQLLLTLGIPLLLLISLSTFLTLNGDGVNVVTPGIMALAVLSTAFTGLAIATGFERRYGVIRSLGRSPLGRSGLLVGKTLAMIMIEVLQFALIVIVATLLGWQPQGSWLSAIVLIVLGTAALSACGFLLAGVMRAEAVLAVANAAFIVLMLAGGIVVPLDRLPSGLAAIAALTPSGALAQGLRDVLTHGEALPLGAVGVLIAWTAAAGIAGARWFKWS